MISREAYVGGLGEWCENHPQNAYLSLEMNSSWNISHLVWIGSAEHWLKQKQEWISPKTIAEGSAKKLAQRRSLFFFELNTGTREKFDSSTQVYIHAGREAMGRKIVMEAVAILFQCIGKLKTVALPLCTPPHRRTAMLASQYLHGDFDGLCVYFKCNYRMVISSFFPEGVF